MTRQALSIAIAAILSLPLLGCNNDPPPVQEAVPQPAETPVITPEEPELTPEEIVVKERKERQYNANEELKKLGIRVMRDSSDTDDSLNLRLLASDVIDDAVFEPLSRLKELRGLTIRFGEFAGKAR